jgi:nitrogen fixation protein FixH
MSEARRRIEPWPIALVALLAAMIGTSVGFYRIATANPDALVARDAFAAGLDYADAARDARTAAERGWSLDVATAPVAQGVRVTLRLRDAAGAPLSVERAVLRRERPAEAGLDADFAPIEDAGVLAAFVPLPRPGRWRLAAAVDREGLRVERHVEVTAP